MRRLALLGVLAGASLLSACGFTPMYGETGVSGGLSRIAVTTPDDRLGYRLREQLEDAFGRDGAQAPLYRLTTEVEQSRRPLGRRIDDTASRYELTVKAAGALTPAAAARRSRACRPRPSPTPPRINPTPPSPPSRTARTGPPPTWPV